MRKRWLPLLLALALLLSLTVAAASSEVRLGAVSTVSGARAGEQFTVNVEIEDNPGFNTFHCALTFDPEEMECLAVNAGELASSNSMMFVANTNADDNAQIAAIAAEDILGGGVLAECTFRARQDLDVIRIGLEDVRIHDEDEVALSWSLLDNSAPQPEQPDNPTRPEEPTRPDNPTRPDDRTEPDEPDPQPDGQIPPAPISFPDTLDHWSRYFVEEAVPLGLFNGYANGNFGPDDPVTRAQFVTVLWRMAGRPAVSRTAPFADIADQSEEFRQAIAWGYDNGYLSGVGDGTFNPNGQLTREAALKILFFYAGGVSGPELLLSETYDNYFSDSGEISDWARAPFYWGVYKEIISGTSDTTLSPQGTVTRGQLAKILVNFVG